MNRRGRNHKLCNRNVRLSGEHLAQYIKQFSPLRVVARDGAANWLRSIESAESAAS
jgi:hypothetical protein